MPCPEPRGGEMRRRDFIKGIAGSGVVGWPLLARAQQGERMRRIGVLLPATADDATFQTFLGAFLQELQSLGWSIGRNVRIDALGHFQCSRHSQTRSGISRAHARCHSGFAVASDPVGNGFVDSLGRPGGNATGFMSFEYSMAAKWLELLKQIAPGVTRVAVFRDTANPSGNALFGVIQAMAPSVRVDVTPANMRDAGEIERFIGAFARTPNGGLIVTASGQAYVYRDLIVTLAARLKLPAVYYEHSFVAAGGLMSYGSDYIDQFRRAAAYVDRILKGEKSADLPVQAPTKFELAINLKDAKAIGLTVPPSLLASANEVFE